MIGCKYEMITRVHNCWVEWHKQMANKNLQIQTDGDFFFGFCCIFLLSGFEWIKSTFDRAKCDREFTLYSATFNEKCLFHNSPLRVFITFFCGFFWLFGDGHSRILRTHHANNRKKFRSPLLFTTRYLFIFAVFLLISSQFERDAIRVDDTNNLMWILMSL